MLVLWRTGRLVPQRSDAVGGPGWISTYGGSTPGQDFSTHVEGGRSLSWHGLIGVAGRWQPYAKGGAVSMEVVLFSPLVALQIRIKLLQMQ